MPDRRQEILLQELKKAEVDSFPQGIYNAMDENGRQMCLSLLTFLVKNTTGHSIDEQGNVEFKYKGEWISKEQLFENFL